MDYQLLPQDKNQPTINRPSATRGTSEEGWNTFIKRWNLFKRGTNIPATRITSQLWQCCDRELEDNLFRDIEDVGTVTEDYLLVAS